MPGKVPPKAAKRATPKRADPERATRATTQRATARRAIAKRATGAATGKKAVPTSPAAPTTSRAPARRAGANPRTAKADGDAPVGRQGAGTASRLIDQRIRELGGWRGETLARMRALVLEADPGMAEEWKWNNPVWSHHGIVCTGEAYTKVVKLTFAQGAAVPDPSRLFNASLDGGTRRAIDIHEGETVDAGAFKALVRAAVAHNGAPAKKR